MRFGLPGFQVQRELHEEHIRWYSMGFDSLPGVSYRIGRNRAMNTRGRNTCIAITPRAIKGGMRMTAMVMLNKKSVPVSQNLSIALDEDVAVAKPTNIVK
jgi:hypothetical protein